MSVLGIDRITYGATDLAACRKFFLDWGLTLVGERDGALDFECLNGCEVRVRRADDPALPPAIEEGPTLREVVWGVETAADLDAIRGRITNAPGFVAEPFVGCTDPNGLAVRFRVTTKRAVEAKGSPVNGWDVAARVDTPSPVYERATPIEVGHVVFFTDKLDAMTRFYTETFGFVVSDSYPGRGIFMRTAPRGGHHDLFLLSVPGGKPGLNHVAFAVRDIHEVFGGGLAIGRAGWETQLGPGRHPISSAYFWYVKNPAGALAEYCANEDVLTEQWQAREFTPGPTVFAEWAIDGGVDGNTRRQKSAKAPDGKFVSEKRA